MPPSPGSYSNNTTAIGMAPMGPPAMGPPNIHHEGPMPPPSSTPNSLETVPVDLHDNGITTTATGTQIFCKMLSLYNYFIGKIFGIYVF